MTTTNGLFRFEGTRRNRIFTVACFLSLAVVGETYDASTGYVTMGSGGGFGKKSFSTSDGWSDGQAPHSGTNYYVDASHSIWYGNWASDPQENNETFKGDKLVFAGSFVYGGNNNTYVGFQKTVWLPGSFIRFWTSNNFLKTDNGEFDVRGTAANPFLLRCSFKDAQVARTWPMDFVSAADGYMKFVKHGDKDREDYAYAFDITFSGDWSAYCGIAEVAHAYSLIFGSSNPTLPGAFKLSAANACFRLDSGTTEYTIGSLETTAAGAIVDLSSGAAPTITNRLTLAPGTIIWHNLLTKYDEANYTTEKLLFTLPKDATVPDFSQVTFVNKNTSSTSRGPLPKVTVRVDQTDDAQKVYLVQRKVVYHTSNDLGSTYSLTLPDAWSDGALPGPTNDYYFYRTPDGKGAQVNFGGVASPYVWTGGTMLMWDQYNDVMLYLDDVTIDDLWFNGGAALRSTAFVKSFKVRGNVSIVSGSFGAADVGRGSPLELYAALHGAANTRFETDYVDKDQTGTPNHTATLSLKGDNSDFKGRLLVGLYDYGKIVAEASSVSNVWLLADNANALGGDPGSFVFNAVSITNGCHLGITEDVSFTVANRGWYFGDGACLDVSDGKVAKVGSTTTIDGEFVKDGAGAAFFTSLVAGPRTDVTRKITVSAGSIGVLAADAFGDLPIAFGSGTGLAVDSQATDETVRTKGVTLDPSKVTSAGSIVLKILGVSADLDSFEPFTVGICTVPTAQASAFAAQFVLKRPVKGIGAKLVTTDNGDGTTTLSACCERSGFAILFR